MNAVYFIKRGGYSLITLWAVVTVAFVLFRLLPGDPSTMMIDPTFVDPAQQAILRARYGLDDPLIVQYFGYFLLLFSGDLGNSYASNVPVISILSSAFVNSFILALSIFVGAYSIGIVVGALAAWWRDSWFDKASVSLGLLLHGLPSFFAGILLIMLFSITLGWLPSSGARSTGFGATSLSARYLNWDFLAHLVLPTVTGVIYTISTPMLLMRNTMLDVLQSDFLELTRAKGLKQSRILFGHGFRNALLPVIAEASQFFAYAIGGLVTIEVVFSWPGLGRVIVIAMQSRDYPVAQGAFLYTGILVIVAYLISDLLTAALDPRTRRTERVVQ